MRASLVLLATAFLLLCAGFPPPALAEGSALVPPARGLSLFTMAPPPLPRPAAPPASASLSTPGQQCRQAIQVAERAAGIPRQLMAAIGRVESGRADASGRIDPWPWSINVEGRGRVFETKAEAIAAVQALQRAGTRSIDVGCMQVNLMYHPDAFASLEQAFDPAANATYAARFLTQLYAKAGSWPAATAAYHSATPQLGAEYERKVASVWPEEQRRTDALPLPPAIGPLAEAGSGAFMLSNRAESARVIPMTGSGGNVSRGLDAYRSAPIPVASRPMPRAPL